MSDAEPAPRVWFTGLCACYGRCRVLHELSAEIPAAVLTSVVGPNGSGKSTLLGVMSGLLHPESGQLVHEGARTPAFVPQRGAVGDALPLTVRQVVEMGRWHERGPWRRLRRQDRAAVDAAMERLGVACLAGRQLGQLSGGQRQRALIAQGLAQQSDLLLLDEPGAGLDVEANERIAVALKEVVADGTTVVQATHDMAAARRGDCCLVLRSGRLLASGVPGDVLTDQTLAALWQS